ncbi:PAQR6 (predicted) [Pycnogonum litorale]
MFSISVSISGLWNRIDDERHKIRQNLKNRNQVHLLIRERGILTGYRPLGTTLKSCAASCLVSTNETLNVWTHGIPALLTLICIVYLPYLNDTVDWTSPISWPCLYFLLTTFTHLFVSALAHTFNSCSFESYQCWFFCDYTAVSFTGLGIAVANDAYAFRPILDDTYFRCSFLYVAALSTATFTFMTCYYRNRMNFIALKIWLFSNSVLHYIWVYYPIVHRLLTCVDRSTLLCDQQAIDYYRYHIFLMLLSGIIFALHFPEIIWPGRFDIYGHSHQLFHMINFIASIMMLAAILCDMETLIGINYVPETVSTFRLILLIAVPVVNIAIVGKFIRKVLRDRK